MYAYKTLAAHAEASLTEKKSRFIAFARPVSTEDDAKAFLAQLRKQYWDASHHVYAYILRDGDSGAVRSRSSDDGEPSGSSGAPVLETLASADVADAMVVVVRYFGGTLLGVGGLIRAYSGAAKAAIANAGIIEKKRCRAYELMLDYALWNRVKYAAAAYPAVAVEYGERITARFLVETTAAAAFEQLIADTVNTAEALTALGEDFY